MEITRTVLLVSIRIACTVAQAQAATVTALAAQSRSWALRSGRGGIPGLFFLRRAAA
jgi:hypothetical protein